MVNSYMISTDRLYRYQVTLEKVQTNNNISEVEGQQIVELNILKHSLCC